MDRRSILRNRGKRTKGTCEWITNLDKYKEWLTAKESNLLWICGQPGRGKTYLSIYLAEKLAETEDAILLEYYCDNKDERRNTASTVVRGLIFGLLNQLPELVRCFKTKLNKQTHKLRDLSFEALWLVFKQMMEESKKPVYCVLDGLDECDPVSVHYLTTSFEELFLHAASENHYLRIVLTSRPLSRIDSTILNSFPHITLDENSQQWQSHTQLDVGIFVETEFSNYFPLDWLMDYFNDATERDTWCYQTKAKIVEMASGTFLWAGFAMQELRETEPPYVDKILKSLPEGLYPLYDRILLQVKETQQQHIAAILRWVVGAVRPMSLAEISAVIPIDGSERFRSHRVIRDLVNHCKGLLVITGETVNLVHQSVKDYILAQGPNSNKPKIFCFKENVIHEEVARKCISYLQCGALADGPVTEPSSKFADQMIPAWETMFPLLSYSILNWPTHARLSDQDIFDDSDPFFTLLSTVREAWLDAFWRLRKDFAQPEFFSLLHIAAFFKLPVLVGRLLSSQWRLFRPSLLNCRDGCSRTPLWWAASKGHETIVKILLEKGATVDAEDFQNETPLLQAVTKGHEAVVKLLLENGAGADFKGNKSNYLLWQAAAGGHEAIFQILIERGAIFIFKGFDGLTQW
jgi:hypothetical protein